MNKNTITLENVNVNVTLHNRLLEYQRAFYQELLRLISNNAHTQKALIFDINTLISLIPASASLQHELQTFQNNNISISGGKSNIFISFDLLSSFEIKQNKVYIEIPAIILNTLINPNFNKYVDLIVCKDLKTNYSIYLYDFLSEYIKENIDQYTINLTVPGLKKIFYVKNKYDLYHGFKKKVILPTIKDLSHLFKKLDFIEIFEKNKVVAIEFQFNI